MSFWGAAVGAIGGLIGTQLSNRASAASVAEQINFQREMANTAHQRQVNDMRLAGLNPILSATGGGGAISPQGAHFQSGDFSGGASGVASTALAALRNREEVKLMRQQQENVFRDTEKKQWEARAQEAFALKAEQETRTEQWETKRAATAFDIMQADAARAWLDRKFWNSPEGPGVRNAQRWGEALAPGVSAAKDLFSIGRRR